MSDHSGDYLIRHLSSLPAVVEVGGEVRRLTMKGGDGIVVRSPKTLAADQVDMIRRAAAAIQRRLGYDHPVLVLDEGRDVQVVEAGS